MIPEHRIKMIFGIMISIGAIFSLYYVGSNLDQSPQVGEGDNQMENISVGTGVGELAPNFTLNDINGNSFSLKDYRGKVVVITFMTTTCGYCKEQMSHLNDIYSSYSEDQVWILSIDIDPLESSGDIRDFKEEHAEDWTFAKGSEVGTTYGVIYIPKSYLINPDGKITYKNTGITSASTLSDKIENAL